MEILFKLLLSEIILFISVNLLIGFPMFKKYIDKKGYDSTDVYNTLGIPLTILMFITIITLVWVM